MKKIGSLSEGSVPVIFDSNPKYIVNSQKPYPLMVVCLKCFAYKLIEINNEHRKKLKSTTIHEYGQSINIF